MFGLWWYSYRGKWVRVRHGLHLGLMALASDEPNRETEECAFQDENDDWFPPLFYFSAHLVSISIRLGIRNIWLEISPANLGYLTWGYGYIGVRFET